MKYVRVLLYALITSFALPIPEAIAGAWVGNPGGRVEVDSAFRDLQLFSVIGAVAAITYLDCYGDPLYTESPGTEVDLVEGLWPVSGIEWCYARVEFDGPINVAGASGGVPFSWTGRLGALLRHPGVDWLD